MSDRMRDGHRRSQGHNVSTHNAGRRSLQRPAAGAPVVRMGGYGRGWGLTFLPGSECAHGGSGSTQPRHSRRLPVSTSPRPPRSGRVIGIGSCLIELSLGETARFAFPRYAPVSFKKNSSLFSSSMSPALRVPTPLSSRPTHRVLVERAQARRALVVGEQDRAWLKTCLMEIISHPVPLNMNTLTALKRSPLGLDLYLWLVYRTFPLRAPLRLTWPSLYRQFGSDPDRARDKRTVLNFRMDCLRELKKIKLAWPELNYATAKGVLILSPSTPAIARSIKAS